MKSSRKCNCYICPATEMQGLLANHKGKHREMWLTVCNYFAKHYGVITLTRAEFFKIYKEGFALNLKKQIISPARQKLCKDCIAMHCDRCKEAINYSSRKPCQNCNKVIKSIRKSGSIGTGEKCFLCTEFKSMVQVTMVADKSIWDPYFKCDACVCCNAQEQGTESIILRDLPLLGHPTIVQIIRTRYVRDDGKGMQTPCPWPLLSGIQRSLSSELTVRLYSACVVSALGGRNFPEVAEWYGISEPYLRKIKKEQAGRVEDWKALLRKYLDVPESRVSCASFCVNNQTFHAYFYAPKYSFSSEPGTLELAGIYSEKEHEYLWRLRVYTIVDYCESRPERPDMPTSRVFSLAYDYASEEGNRILSQPIIYALLMAMADSICRLPFASVAYEYSAIHHRMTTLAEDDGSVKEMLALAKATYNYIPDSFRDTDLVAYTDRLVEYLKTMLSCCDNQDLLLLSSYRYASHLNREEDVQASKSVKLISRYLLERAESDSEKDFSLIFDEVRDDLLFFNQSVVPCRYDKHEDKYIPMLDQNGDIDTETIKTIGVSCSSLDRLFGHSYWETEC